MRSGLNPRAVAAPAFTIRFATPAEIDVLSDIDLDASVLFERAGLHVDFSANHEFSIAERNGLFTSLAERTTVLAVDARGHRVGFAAVRTLDGEPYLEQLSVRTEAMGRGVGTALIDSATRLAERAGGRALWLTTYDHLPWNRPFYERRGFEKVAPDAWGAEIGQVISFQQRWLPRPDDRVVMRKRI